MKKIIKVLSCIVAPVVAACAFLTGCKKCGKDVDTPAGEIMQDMEVAPTQTAAYEQYSKAAIDEYKAVASNHLLDGDDVDIENEEVQAAAKAAAAKLFAYACYNERHLDKYAYFSHQEGDTDLGKTNGSGTAIKQEYFLRINESEETCGYRYFYTLKKVMEASGAIKTFKSSFESAKLRVTDQTDLLYRFQGDNIRLDAKHEVLDIELLACDWKTDSSDWGVPELKIKKREFIEPENIEEDIQRWAGVDIPGQDCGTIHANINILAENIIEYASIFEDEEGGAFVIMTIDADVANSDDASLKMLRQGNGSKNCTWRTTVNEDGGEDPGLTIVFRLWDNGLFRMFNVAERWHGSMMGIYSGTVDSTTITYYSYSDRDCDMVANLAMLESAKAAVG
ncbi:MAG: hypothetical protein K2N33_01945 [Clostridia bacterium]|nr:hypothetical protein [Clostridia bacterium]